MSALRQRNILGHLEPAFVRVVEARLGHDLGGRLGERLGPAVVQAAKAIEEPSLARMLERVQERDPMAEQGLVDALTIGETYFFRDPQHFEFLRELLVARRASDAGRLRLWSAGCATGEEAYSMAMLALEVFGETASAFVEVVATDVNSDFLRRARLGVYGSWSFRGTSPRLKELWFEKSGARFRVKPMVRALVSFAHANLVAPADAEVGPTDVDVTFCRNVLVYFARDGIRAAQRRLASGLRFGGWLVPGPSDPLLDSPDLGIELSRGFIMYERCARGAARPASGVVRAARAAPQPPEKPPEKPSPRVSPAPAPKVRKPALAATTSPVARPPPPPAPDASHAVVTAQKLAAGGALEDALVCLDEALLADRLNAPAYAVRGSLRLAAGNAVGALEDASKAVLLDRTLVFAHVVTAMASARLVDADRVVRACRVAGKALAALEASAEVPLAGGATAGELFAACRDAERAVQRRKRGPK